MYCFILLLSSCVIVNLCLHPLLLLLLLLLLSLLYVLFLCLLYVCMSNLVREGNYVMFMVVFGYISGLCTV